MELVPYTIVKGKNGDAWVEAKRREIFAITDFPLFTLQKMKETAEAYLGETRDAGGYHCSSLF